MHEDAPTSHELHEQARSAWIFGLTAKALAMVACGSYVTLLAALPLGLLAMSRARALLEGPHALDPAVDVYARTAKVSGLMAALWSGLLIALFAAIVLLYVGVFAMVLASAGLQPPPPSPAP